MAVRIETRSSLIYRIRDPSDSASWSEFVALYEPMVCGLARRMGVGVNDVDDVAQEVFSRIAQAISGFELDRQRGRFGTWLWKVVRNIVMDHFRHQQRLGRPDNRCVEQIAAVEASEPDQEWQLEQRRHVFQHAMSIVRGRVQPRTWACFSEHLLKGQSAEEVAETLGISTNSVYVNASRVLASIREQCADYLEDLGDD
jgi:RNA polymerase sigma-70 factor, ECF subfamily